MGGGGSHILVYIYPGTYMYKIKKGENKVEKGLRARTRNVRFVFRGHKTLGTFGDNVELKA